MIIVRTLAALVLLLAAVALISDVTQSMSAGRMVVTPLANQWRALSPQSLTATANAVKSGLHPLVWDLLLWRLLLLPGWLSLGSIGVLLGMLGRRQRRVNIFIN
jgi:hypothetical protein